MRQHVEPRLSGLTQDDLYFLAMMRIQWPELVEQFQKQEAAQRGKNTLRDPGFYRPPGRLE